ncbi:MAG: hypothetical protein ACQES8_10080 [Thermodesulfobacteriota bacterium]
MNKRLHLGLTLCCLALISLISGCLSGMQKNNSALNLASSNADQKMYKAIEYPNADKKGPTVVVLPGKIKSNNASFHQKITANNIADFGELELGKANFGVLERSDLGPLLDEINLAVNMGDPTALKKFKRGKFKSTKWFIKFDILKAERVASAKKGFNGRAVGSVLGTLIGGRSGSVTNTAVSSVENEDAGKVWVIGMRYKVMDASTSEQMATNYYEDKMEVGKQGTSIMGVSQDQGGGVTLDSMVQRLVQKAVADLDRKK